MFSQKIQSQPTKDYFLWEIVAQVPLLTYFFSVGLALGWGVRRFHNDIYIYMYVSSNPTDFGKSQTPNMAFVKHTVKKNNGSSNDIGQSRRSRRPCGQIRFGPEVLHLSWHASHPPFCRCCPALPRVLQIQEKMLMLLRSGYRDFEWDIVCVILSFSCGYYAVEIARFRFLLRLV